MKVWAEPKMLYYMVQRMEVVGCELLTTGIYGTFASEQSF